MSEMRPDVDLATLARAPAGSALPPRRRRRFAQAILLLLVLGFASLLFSTVRDSLRGAVPVTVLRPQAAAASAAGAGSIELQRSGWIEPDPYPVHAAALAPGVVRTMLALEGDAVESGQPLALLVDDDARVELSQAEAALARAQADGQKARVERDLARESFDAALEVTEAEASAAADLAGRTAEAQRRAAAARESRARVRIAEEELAIQRFLAENGGAGPRQVELAQARLEGERAALATVEAEAALAAAEAEKAKARLARAAGERQLRLADRLRRDSAEAQLATAEAAAAEAFAVREAAALKLERMTVRAPVKGVVMERLAAPGMSVGVAGSETVCSLFDPGSLRVRVDLEQSEVARVSVGQLAQVKAPTRAEALYDAEVVRIVRLANIEKVTLQVHVRVRDPDAALRPEMLVEVRFLAVPRAPDGAGGDAAASSMPSGAVWIPRRLVTTRDGAPAAWAVDALSGRATLRRIETARDEGERTLVARGLNVSDKLIDGGRDRLREGARVEIAEREE